MTAFTDLLVTLITTNFDTSLRTESATKPDTFNVSKYTTKDGKKLPFPKANYASIAVYPAHVDGALQEVAEDFRDKLIVNRVDVYSYKSENDLDEIINALEELLDCHQVTNCLKHWLDDGQNLSGTNWMKRANIYTLKGEEVGAGK